MRVAVLRGGPSHEYDVSLKSGEHILSILRRLPEKYSPVDILIARDGTWHKHGRTVEPHRALEDIDLVFNALHGAYGEDGQVQQLLTALRVPYTGSDSLASAIAMNKDMAKEVYRRHGLKTPRHEVLEGDVTIDKLIDIFRSFPHPVIVKPANSGSSIGVRLAYGFDGLKEAVAHTFAYADKVLVEEFIRGKEATCAVVEDFRGEKLYALIPVEIQKPDDSGFFDYDAKYSGKTKELCPGTFKPAESKMIESIARIAHGALGLRHYSRSDFIVAKNGNVYILETNSLPGFTPESLLPRSLAAVHAKPQEFIEHIISIAR